MPAVKKYKLFKPSEASKGSKPVCAFFTSPDGCRNGDKCSFLHGPPQPSAVEISETASVISSEESEGEIERVQLVRKQKVENPPTPSTPKVEQQGKNKKRKAKSSTSGDDLFANPKDKNHAPTPTPTKRIKVTDDAKAMPSTKAKRENVTPKTKSPPVGDFRSLLAKLPVASFSIPGVSDGARKESANQKVAKKETSEKAVAAKKEPQDILPMSSDAGRKWIKAVEKSRDHERYANSFDFAKYKQMNEEAGIPSEWIRAKPFGSWCKTNPQAIAIDCEMCETQDPLTGAKNPKALCRVSIVNAENPEEVLLDTLVKPTWPVTDYRTRINGISKEDLEKVEFTLRHAQAFMMHLCSDETVIVGHAVHNDLSALTMEHYCVADSSFLFFAKDSTSSPVSLRDLVSTVLNMEMPHTHDSVNDARKALECVKHWVDKDGDVEMIERTAKHKGNQLFVHRIPKQCKTHHLTNMFIKHTSVEPSDIDDIEFTGETGKTHVSFRSTRHASLAFDTIEGTAETDKSGRLQKKVFLRSGDYVRVRKMISGRGGSPHKPSAH